MIQSLAERDETDSNRTGKCDDEAGSDSFSGPDLC